MPNTKKLVCNKCGHERLTDFNSRYRTCEKCKKGRYYAVNECLICKKQFKTHRRDQQVCSRECRQKWSKVYLKKTKTRKCRSCGERFEARGEFGGKKRIYCSLECFKTDVRAYRSKQRRTDVDFNDNNYKNAHRKIAQKLGKGKICWECGKKVKGSHSIGWASLDHKYSDNPKDWARLCRHCHYYYDKKELKLTLKYKTPEEWKGIDGYKNRYEVSTYGRVRRVACISVRKRSNGQIHHAKLPERLIKLMFTKRGYLKAFITFENKHYKSLVHRLVAIAFIPNAKGLKAVNHKNGVKIDNRVENLEWMTYKENYDHALNTGLIKREHTPFGSWFKKV